MWHIYNFKLLSHIFHNYILPIFNSLLLKISWVKYFDIKKNATVPFQRVTSDVYLSFSSIYIRSPGALRFSTACNCSTRRVNKLKWSPSYSKTRNGSRASMCGPSIIRAIKLRADRTLRVYLRLSRPLRGRKIGRVKLRVSSLAIPLRTARPGRVIKSDWFTVCLRRFEMKAEISLGDLQARGFTRVFGHQRLAPPRVLPPVCCRYL